MKYPTIRMRRRRLNAEIRSLVCENKLHPNNFILPLFVVEGQDIIQAIPSMPGANRYSIDNIIEVVQQAYDLGINCIALFPVVPDEKKDELATEALKEDNLISKTIEAIKEKIPTILITADVALDPYTSHGQDGILDDNGYVDNDVTVEVLAKQSLLLANAGADIIAPSDMMDGRVLAIRGALDQNSYQNKLILSYTVKYASVFYGPFRDAVGSGSALKGDKKTYQMDPANGNEAIMESKLDIDEGADILMVKPAMPYLDIIHRLKQEHNIPIFAYQVSGEYASIKASSLNGWIDEEQAMMESLICIRRAGASAILTYFAIDAAKKIQ